MHTKQAMSVDQNVDALIGPNERRCPVGVQEKNYTQTNEKPADMGQSGSGFVNGNPQYLSQKQIRNGFNSPQQGSPALSKGCPLLFQSPDERHRIFKKILAHFNVKVHNIETRSFMKIFGLQIKSITNDLKSAGGLSQPANPAYRKEVGRQPLPGASMQDTQVQPATSSQASLKES